MRRFLDDPLGLTGHGEIRFDVAGLADSGPAAPTARDDPRPLCDKQPRGRKTDPLRRARDEAGPVAKPEIHGSLAYPA